jgi:peroxiredoxin
MNREATGTSQSCIRNPEEPVKTAWISPRPALVATALCILTLVGAPASALDVGDEAYDFEAPLLDGDQTVHLSDHRGKVVYLDFWASWCNPCTKAIPAIEQLRKEFPETDFQVLAVNVDKSKKKATQFLDKTPIGYPSVADPRGKLPRRFGLETMPTSYLIDREGVIRYVHRGFRSGDVDELRAQIQKLVGVPASRKK